MWQMHDGWGWWMVFDWLWMVIVWGLIIWAVLVVSRLERTSPQQDAAPPAATAQHGLLRQNHKQEVEGTEAHPPLRECERQISG